MSKVLVIHPNDESTTFLKYVYKDYNYDIITDPNYDRKKLAQQIDLHDKIIMLGHGTSYGLLNPKYLYNTNNHPFIIDESFSELLKKKETISIWCFSDVFAKRVGLKGFHTGMIISECTEQQIMLGKVFLDKQHQLYNMINFAKIVGDCIENSPEEMREYILNKYNYPDEVTKFNRKNIIVL